MTTEHETFREPQTNFEERLDHQDLEGIVNDLPPAQRQAIRLLKLREISLKEATVMSGMSVTSLKVNAHRALKSLKKMLIDRSEP